MIFILDCHFVFVLMNYNTKLAKMQYFDLRDFGGYIVLLVLYVSKTG